MLLGEDAPVAVEQIETRLVAEQIHAGLEVALDGSDVQPIATIAVGHDALALDHRRDDMVTKIQVGALIVHLLQDVDERRATEDVHTHRREIALGVLRLLLEFDDASAVVRGQDAEVLGLVPRDFDDADRGVRVGLGVTPNQPLVVHLVDVIAAEDQRMRGARLAQDVEVLDQRVRRAAVP